MEIEESEKQIPKFQALKNPKIPGSKDKKIGASGQNLETRYSQNRRIEESNNLKIYNL